MHFDTTRPIDIDMRILDTIIKHEKPGFLISMDSNSRSNSWHDVLTNGRGRTLEGDIMCKMMHIMDEDSRLTTYVISCGTCIIDLKT